MRTLREQNGLPRRAQGALLAKTNAFTMAEILLSLTIIGVVAAITLPSLTGNINERVWNTQRKALYARMSQALALLPQLNGYGTYSESTSGDSKVITDTGAEAFITEGLSKVLKINNICDNAHLSDCGIPTSFTDMTGSLIAFPKKLKSLHRGWSSNYGTEYSNMNPNAAAFETQNGESVAVFYNTQCAPDLEETNEHSPQRKVCVNFIYDLNGIKGPNTMGKDIGFITAIYATNPVIVAPQPLATNTNNGEGIAQTDAQNACIAQDSESRVPNKEELTSVYYNMLAIGGLTSGEYYWSSTTAPSSKAWVVRFGQGIRYTQGKSAKNTVRCIKR